MPCGVRAGADGTATSSVAVGPSATKDAAAATASWAPATAAAPVSAAARVTTAIAFDMSASLIEPSGIPTRSVQIRATSVGNRNGLGGAGWIRARCLPMFDRRLSSRLEPAAGLSSAEHPQQPIAKRAAERQARSVAQADVPIAVTGGMELRDAIDLHDR